MQSYECLTSKSLDKLDTIASYSSFEFTKVKFVCKKSQRLILNGNIHIILSMILLFPISVSFGPLSGGISFFFFWGGG